MELLVQIVKNVQEAKKVLVTVGANVRVMALGRGQENVRVTVDMKETCAMSVLSCTLKSKMKILKPNVQRVTSLVLMAAVAALRKIAKSAKQAGK